MRRLISLLISVQTSLILNGQIIADHTIVDRFDDIPQEYINKVKEMWLVYAGESHSNGVRTGLALLEASNYKYQVNVKEWGTPETYTNQYLRANGTTWGDLNNSSVWIYSYGEEDWFTSSTAISATKAGITYCNTNSLVIAAMGFGWCWDQSIKDMTDYLKATKEYIDYCRSNSYSTKIFFTTGPVDEYNATGEIGYNKYLAYESIRNYVDLSADRILFDYADILCFDDGSKTPNTTTWDGHTYPIITTTNLLPVLSGHISQAGGLRLAKAMWWMLARIAGWDGVLLGVGDTGNNTKSIKKIVTSHKIEMQLGDGYISWDASLFDFQGISISSKPVESDILTFDASSLSSGIYFVVLSNGESRLVVKVIKP